MEAVPWRLAAGRRAATLALGDPRVRFCGHLPMWAASSSCEYSPSQYGHGISVRDIFLAHCCAWCAKPPSRHICPHDGQVRVRGIALGLQLRKVAEPRGHQ